MINSIIEVSNLSKSYTIFHEGKERYTALRDVMAQKAKKIFSFPKSLTSTLASTSSKEEFWALKDVSFKIEQGDRVGIIGRNGAGKSTLLKILSRITEPTSGEIKIKGRVASLLEVGTGFHPELTGRENIFLNGAILGMSRVEIKKHFDAIVDFAEVEKFLDTPVKRYSSGMYVRLAFAVAAHLEPEILVVDEVLAVGDAEFQKKCLGKMEDISVNYGRTVLFVSHNLSLIQSLCNRGLLLSEGQIVIDSEIGKTLSIYGKGNDNHATWIGLDGDENILITSTSIKTNKDEAFINNSDEIFIIIEFEVVNDLSQLMVSLNLIGNGNKQLVRLDYNDFNEIETLKKGSYLITFTIPSYTLATGYYSIKFDIAIPNVKKINSDMIDLNFEVIANSELGNKYHVINSNSHNSIIRPDWYREIKKTN